MAAFREASAAYIARAMLEAEGIPAHIADEHTVGAFWLYSQAVGGVKLQVAEVDFERAHRLLAEDRSSLVPEPPAPAPGDVYECPACRSGEVRHPRAHRWSAVLSWVLSFPLVFWSRSLRCATCGHRWRP